MRSIVIDILGGDDNSFEILEGLKEYSKKAEYRMVIVGPKKDILKYLSEEECLIIDIEKEVTNQTSPMAILHDLEDTALVASYNYLKNHEDAIGLLTCSSTGCVLTGSIFKLGLIKGIKMPYLAAEMFNTDFTRFLIGDCGANIDIPSSSLYDFAKIGNAFMLAKGNKSPRIGLLNLGVEEGKGNKVMKEAYNLLKASSLNFVGNIEFDSIYQNKADVLVCDGAIGNSIIKNTEGVAKTILNSVPLDSTAKEHIHHLFGYNDYGSAILLGPKKIILKAHGKANRNTIIESLKNLEALDKGGFIQYLEKEFTI